MSEQLAQQVATASPAKSMYDKIESIVGFEISADGTHLEVFEQLYQTNSIMLTRDEVGALIKELMTYHAAITEQLNRNRG